MKKTSLGDIKDKGICRLRECVCHIKIQGKEKSSETMDSSVHSVFVFFP